MNWYHLIKLAAYERWIEHIEQLSKQNPYPFSSWFDEGGRSYIPFETPQIEQMFSQDDKYVVDHLQENGCTDINYRDGYCIYKGRQYKIGKLLESLRRKDLLEIRQKVEIDPESYYNVDREINETNEWYNDLVNTFINSPIRRSKGRSIFQVVISQNPHDVASMSTDRDWTSCMNLGEGSQTQSVFCEVSSGGLVAYLINYDDIDIKNPLARIHIRRFENKDGSSIAVPEDSIYGNEVPGFRNVIEEWLKGKQGSIGPGMYRRMGGEHSDSFGDELLVAPSTEEQLQSWLKGTDPNAIYYIYTVEDQLARNWNEEYDEHRDDGMTDQSREFTNKEEAEAYLEELEQYSPTEEEEWYRKKMAKLNEDEDSYWQEWYKFDKETGEYVKPRYKMLTRKKDLTSTMQRQAVDDVVNAEKGKCSPETIQMVHNLLFFDEPERTRSIIEDTGGTRKSKFISKYPEYVTDDDIKQLEGRRRGIVLLHYDSFTEEQQAALKEGYTNQLLTMLENPELIIKEEFSPNIRDLDIRVRNTFNEYIIQPLQKMYDQIPESLIRQLIDFARLNPYPDNQLDHVSLALNKAKPRYMWIEIARLFNSKDADTPAVQEYYKSLLPYWGENHRFYGPVLGTSEDSYSSINIETLGYYISQLGENGRDFIPFIKTKLSGEREKLERIKQEDPERGPHTPIPTKWKTMAVRLEKNIESYLYILDHLESGGHPSRKYRFNFR